MTSFDEMIENLVQQARDTLQDENPNDSPEGRIRVLEAGGVNTHIALLTVLQAARGTLHILTSLGDGSIDQNIAEMKTVLTPELIANGRDNISMAMAVIATIFDLDLRELDEMMRTPPDVH